MKTMLVGDHELFPVLRALVENNVTSFRVDDDRGGYGGWHVTLSPVPDNEGIQLLVVGMFQLELLEV